MFKEGAAKSWKALFPDWRWSKLYSPNYIHPWSNYSHSKLDSSACIYAPQFLFFFCSLPADIPEMHLAIVLLLLWCYCELFSGRGSKRLRCQSPGRVTKFSCRSVVKDLPRKGIVSIPAIDIIMLFFLTFGGFLPTALQRTHEYERADRRCADQYMLSLD